MDSNSEPQHVPVSESVTPFLIPYCRLSTGPVTGVCHSRCVPFVDKELRKRDASNFLMETTQKAILRGINNYGLEANSTCKKDQLQVRICTHFRTVATSFVDKFMFVR